MYDVLLLDTALHIISIVNQSVLQVVDLVDGLSTLSDNLAGVLLELLKVLLVDRLVSNGG